MIKLDNNQIPHFISSFELEEARLAQAIQKAKLDLIKIGERKQLNILEDHDFFRMILLKIKNESVNAEYAMNEVSIEVIALLKSTKNPILKERACDIENVVSRLLSSLLKLST